MIRGPAKSLARVLPHSRIATHPTFVREAARSDAVVSSPVVTAANCRTDPRSMAAPEDAQSGYQMVARAVATAGPGEMGCAVYATMSHTMAKWLTAPTMVQACQTSWKPNTSGRESGRPRRKTIAPTV